MHYNEESLMEAFDKWKEDDRRERFFHRMEHKLNVKERKFSQSHR